MWLDLVAFARALLTDRYVISEVKYFTARIRSDRFAAISPHDQSCYFDALGTNPVVKVVEGYYRRFRAKLPFAKEPCTSCGKVGYATVWKTEEKKSDVNLAVEMVSDAYENRSDAVVLISGDADHSAALSVVRVQPSSWRMRRTAQIIHLLQKQPPRPSCEVPAAGGRDVTQRAHDSPSARLGVTWDTAATHIRIIDVPRLEPTTNGGRAAPQVSGLRSLVNPRALAQNGNSLLARGGGKW